MLLKTLSYARTLFFMLYIIGAALLWLCIPKPDGHYDIDSYGYDPIAWHFAQTGTLTDPNNISSAPVQPVGYHFMMGVLFMLFGHSFVAVVWFQILLMACSLMLLMRIGAILFNAYTAYVVGLLALCNIGFFVYPQLLLAETMLLFVLLCFLERYSLFLKDGQTTDLAASAGCLGISLLFKPVALLLIFPLMIITCCVHVHVRQAALRYGCILLVSFTIPVMLYMARNAACYGEFAFAPMGPLNLYQCLLAKVIGMVEHKDPQEIIETRLRFQAVHSLDSAGWNSARADFYRYLYAYPHLFLYVWMSNVLKTWLGLYTTQLKRMAEPSADLNVHSYFNQQGSLAQRLYQYVSGGTSYATVRVIAWFELVYAAIRLMLALMGMWLLWCNKQRTLFWLFLSMMISFSVLTGIDGCCRYRLTFEPILLLLAGVSLVYIGVYVEQKRKGCWYGVCQ